MQHNTPAVSDDIRSRREELGRHLRALREERGISLQSLAQATRISGAFLEALEVGAFERLPGQVFGRGFVRGLCKHLAASDEKLLEAYDACWQAPTKERSVLKVEIKNKPRPEASEFWQIVGRRLRQQARPRALVSSLALAAVVVVVILAGKQVPQWPSWMAALKGKFSAVSASMERAAPQARAPAVPAALEVAKDVSSATQVPELEQGKGAEKTADNASSQPVTSPDGLAVEAKIKKEPSRNSDLVESASRLAAIGSANQVLEVEVTTPVRIRIGLDGEGAETKELAPQIYRFSFQNQADLMIYDAAAVKLSFNGRQLGSLGAKGRVRRLSFKADPPPEKKL